MEKKIAGFYITVPCVDNVGSCTYNDICKDWAQVCPQYAKFGIPCTCPIPANTYTITDLVADITTKLPSVIDGDFRITANILSPTAGHVFCLQAEVTLG
jgi:ganglioside GM2 activator